jgi:hypothetical protein
VLSLAAACAVMGFLEDPRAASADRGTVDIVGDQLKVEPAAEAILARARNWAGGPALDRVQSLVIEATEGPRGQNQRRYEIRLLRPDRYQSRTQSGIVHTFEGSKFWQTSSPGREAILTPAIRATAERNTLSWFVRHATTLFLRPPPGYSVAVANAGRVQVEGWSGVGVRVSLPGRDADTFIFDPADGRPIAYFRDVSPAGERRVGLFLDYRVVGGVRFPFHIETRYLKGGEVLDWKVSDIRLNGLKLADFQRDVR